MAKKKINKKQKMVAEEFDNTLPQNILPFGERVEEDKNIYISQRVYKDIHKFTQDKTTNESGGMLIGSVIEEFGKTNIIIHGFIEAKYSKGTPTTLKFTHQTWDHVHSEMAKKYSGQKIVGWIHTHPDFGIFLSEYDKFIQENFFKEDYQIAYVVDPIQNIEGFYFWINGKIERCKGFYVFDKNGVKITVTEEKEADEHAYSLSQSAFSLKNITISILSVAVVILLFMNIGTSNRLKEIESQQKTIVQSANTGIAFMQQQISDLTSRIFALEKLTEEQEETSSEDTQETDSNASETDESESADNDTSSNISFEDSEESNAFDENISNSESNGNEEDIISE